LTEEPRAQTRRPDDVEQWAAARTLADLGELTARWLEGSLGYQPAFEGERPSASEPRVPALIAANRAGFVTHYSQSGLALDEGRGQQRAVVCGFGAEETMHRIGRALLGTDLVALVYPPGGRLDGLQIPVSVSGGLVGTWAGAEMPVADIVEYFGGDCHRLAVEALCASWQATLFDPHWGRDDLLWDRLRAVADEARPSG